VVAFIASLLILGLMVGTVLAVGRRRTPGTPLTWGEAFVAGTFMFALLFVLYGVVPHYWLAWADSELQWRSDKIGIPLGPLGSLFGVKDNLLFPKGVPLPNGHFVVTAQVLRDIVAATIYIAGLGLNFGLWLTWQKRGKRPAVPELETSAYGRPLIRAAD
jgi:hypothetical protein